VAEPFRSGQCAGLVLAGRRLVAQAVVERVDPAPRFLFGPGGQELDADQVADLLQCLPSSIAAFVDLNQVMSGAGAELVLDRPDKIPGGRAEGGLLEGLRHRSAPEVAEIAAPVAGRLVVRVFTGQLGEILAGVYPAADLAQQGSSAFAIPFRIL